VGAAKGLQKRTSIRVGGGVMSTGLSAGEMRDFWVVVCVCVYSFIAVVKVRRSLVIYFRNFTFLVITLSTMLCVK
jgi:hypothetical protein